MAVIVRKGRARRTPVAESLASIMRSVVEGELDVEGDLKAALSIDPPDLHASQLLHASIPVLRASARSRALGPPKRPPEEVRLRGRRHTPARDAAAVAHHSDVSNDFYRLLLGDTMTYSCAFFSAAGVSLAQAQEAKYDLVCRKLGLEPGMRLLDVGCGWGGMALHAATWYGVSVVGVTVSRSQAACATARVASAGFQDAIEIRHADYREVVDGPFDAISSIGMFEHVGERQLSTYFSRMFELVHPTGRMLNHGITDLCPRRRRHRRSFIQRYVFPDAELHHIGHVVDTMEHAGFEIRDVEALREHYVRTLDEWRDRLESRWDDAVRPVGEPRARVWRLYMARSAVAFERGRIGVHQVLGVHPERSGRSAMPATRRGWSEQ